jgi:hypothetical protein
MESRGSKCSRIPYDLKGKSIVTYTWGLGEASNNQAKEYALLYGILLVKEAKVKAFIVIEDFMVFIKLMIGKTSSLDNEPAIIIAQIKKEAISFSKST